MMNKISRGCLREFKWVGNIFKIFKVLLDEKLFEPVLL